MVSGFCESVASSEPSRIAVKACSVPTIPTTTDVFGIGDGNRAIGLPDRAQRADGVIVVAVEHRIDLWVGRHDARHGIERLVSIETALLTSHDLEPRVRFRERFNLFGEPRFAVVSGRGPDQAANF
jgi:hypothetical protein